MILPLTALAAVVLAFGSPPVRGGAAAADVPGKGSLPERPAVLEEITDLIRSQERFAEAARRARELLPGFEKDYGPASVEVAWLLDLIVEALTRDVHGREDETLRLARQSVAIMESRLGSDHLEVTASLINLGEVHAKRGEDGEALRLFEEAVARRERVLPPGHRHVWLARIYVAAFHLRRQRYDEARAGYEKALAGLPPAGGPDAARLLSDRLLTLRSLGMVLRETEAYSEALRLYREVLELLRRTDQELDVASTLNSLALLEDDLGLYGDAVRHYQEALEIRKRRLEPDHPYIAHLHNNLGISYRSMGRYDEALEEFELARVAYAVRKAEIDLALVNHNTAQTLSLMRDYDEADRIFEQALKVRLELLHENDHGIADTREYFASMLLEVGDCEGARVQVTEALHIATERYRDAPVERARFLTTLARVEGLCGDPGKEVRLLEEALAARRNALGEEHPWTAESYRMLAGHHARSGEYGNALAIQSRAVTGLRRSLHEDHPLLLQALVEEAELQACTGQLEAAFAQTLQAGRRLREHVRSTIRVLPARQALKYSMALASASDLTLSMAAGKLRSGSTSRAAWAALVGSRSLVLEEMATRWAQVQRSEEGEILRLRQDLEMSTRRLAEVLLRGPAGPTLDRYRDLLAELGQEAERRERDLARVSDVLRADYARPLIGFSDVDGALPNTTALVAFAEYHRIPCLEDRAKDQPSASGDGRQGTAHYAALVRPAGGGEITIRPLGPASGIEPLVRDWIRSAGASPPGDPQAARNAEDALSVIGAELRKRVWDPVRSQIGEAQEVILVPAGELQLVNFAALPAPGGGYLVEAGPTLRYVSTERDLVESERTRPSGTRLLAMGGPDFNESSAPSPVPSGGPQSGTALRGSDGINECPQLQDLKFPPLEEAAREAEEIGRLWRQARTIPTGRVSASSTAHSPGDDVAVLTDKEATEAAFKLRAPGSRLLHVATHAFSLGDDCRSVMDSKSAATDTRAISTLSPAGRRSVLRLPSGDPLLLAGLAFAGANRRELLSPGHEAEDGILTAAEIAALNLQGVELAVLSACDTGRGRIESGEGIYGLRRAFEIAGAASVVVSLWKVEDRAAREWMTDLYRARLERGERLSEAVRTVSRALLARQREQRQSGHPYRWAAFVAVGARE